MEVGDDLILMDSQIKDPVFDIVKSQQNQVTITLNISLLFLQPDKNF
jgi:hypothetical protein